MEVNINWIGVFVAAIANMAIGFVWYSDVLFGKPWRKLSGTHASDAKPKGDQMIKIIIIGIVGAVITAYVLKHSVVFAGNYLNQGGLFLGLMTGFWSWLGFMVPVLVNGYLYYKQSLNLVLINAGYQLVSLLVMGVILVLWA